MIFVLHVIGSQLLTRLPSEWPKLHGVLAILSATGLKEECPLHTKHIKNILSFKNKAHFKGLCHPQKQTRRHNDCSPL